MTSTTSPAIPLPTLPTVALKLLETFSDPDVSISDIVGVVHSDPAICSKMLKAANSPMYGGNSEVATLDRAVIWLGKNVVTSLALSFSLAENAIADGPLKTYYEDYWRQAVIQGIAAEMLMKFHSPGDESTAFVTGLLMNIGRLALLNAQPDVYTPVLDRARDDQRPLHEVERQILDITHADVSRDMLSAWRLPQIMITAASRQNVSPKNIPGCSGDVESCMIAAAAAAAAVGDFFCGTNVGDALGRIAEITAEHFQFTEADLEEFLSGVSERMNETAELFSADASAIPSVVELLAAANEQLTAISLRQNLLVAESAGRSEQLSRENSQLQGRVSELEQRICVDALTGVYSREYFMARIDQRIRECHEVGESLGLIFVDVDDFKVVNDSYGHLVGDDVLSKVAQAIRKSIRESDVVARYGGDEFVVLVSAEGCNNVERVADRIRENIADSPIEHEDIHLPITLSLGIAFTQCKPPLDGVRDRLIGLADSAMYRAKRAGGNRACSDNGEPAVDAAHRDAAVATAAAAE